MADPSWKANVAVVVGGRAVKAGATFTAPAAQVADAVARRMVEPAPVTAKGKRA
jgi:hypothetical protein